MLENELKSYRKAASKINWKKCSGSELFFKYIEHENDDLRDDYFAAIMCRYWGYVIKEWRKTNNRMPIEYCYDIIIDTVRYVLLHRVWENKDSSLYNNPNAPDIAFHKVIGRFLNLKLRNITATKRLSDYNPASMDELHEEYKDAADGLFFVKDNSEHTGLNAILDDLKNKKEYFSILVIDVLCYNSESILQANVAKNLQGLCIYDYDYYKATYDIPENEFSNCLDKIKDLNTSELKREIRKVLYLIRKEYYE